MHCLCIEARGIRSLLFHLFNSKIGKALQRTYKLKLSNMMTLPLTSTTIDDKGGVVFYLVC
jgi:hypothetical protein